MELAYLGDPYCLGESLKTLNANSTTFNFLPVPLGWCDTGNDAVVNFTKEGNCTYYQWGRKDPMPPILAGNHDKTLYYDNSICQYKAVNMPNRPGLGDNYIDFGTAIEHPYDFYKSAESHYMWSDFMYNLWNMQLTEGSGDHSNYNVISKTIYDPSPVGYVVSPAGTLNSNNAIFWNNYPLVGYRDFEGTVKGYGDDVRYFTVWSGDNAAESFISLGVPNGWGFQAGIFMGTVPWNDPKLGFFPGWKYYDQSESTGFTVVPMNE